MKAKNLQFCRWKLEQVLLMTIAFVLIKVSNKSDFNQKEMRFSSKEFILNKSQRNFW